jgi:hypothetical protein
MHTLDVMRDTTEMCWRNVTQEAHANDEAAQAPNPLHERQAQAVCLTAAP